MHIYILCVYPHIKKRAGGACTAGLAPFPSALVHIIINASPTLPPIENTHACQEKEGRDQNSPCRTTQLSRHSLLLCVRVCFIPGLGEGGSTDKKGRTGRQKYPQQNVHPMKEQHQHTNTQRDVKKRTEEGGKRRRRRKMPLRALTCVHVVCAREVLLLCEVWTRGWERECERRGEKKKRT